MWRDGPGAVGQRETEMTQCRRKSENKAAGPNPVQRWEKCTQKNSFGRCPGRGRVGRSIYTRGWGLEECTMGVVLNWEGGVGEGDTVG